MLCIGEVLQLRLSIVREDLKRDEGTSLGVQ